ncbi:MAG: hypothetical protein AAGD40_02225, partial [Pseudomonadota bacterium]
MIFVRPAIMIVGVVLLLASSVGFGSSAARAEPASLFTIAGEAIEPGTRRNLRLPVPAAGDEPGTFIPVTVVHGDEAGPVLATVSGVHGFEFAPIIAADRLAETIAPADLSGTLI